MPAGPRHPCPVPGCPQLLEAGVSRCPDHRRQRERAREVERPERDRFYDSRWWRAFRRVFLARHALCEMDCAKEGRLTPATDVDHVKPISTEEGWALRLDESNCRAGCHACHSRRTARDQSGWGRGVKSLEACHK